jgi:hypothetical protein
VILTGAPSDYSSREEAKLIRSGHSGLEEVFRSSNLTIYEVPQPRSMITGPGRPRVLALSSATIRLELPDPGRYRLAVRYSPYLRAAGVCVGKRSDGMTGLIVRRRVVTELKFDFDLGRALKVLVGTEKRSC